MQYTYHKNTLLWWLCLLVLLVPPPSLSAQTNEGRDFWLIFIENLGDQNQDELFLHASTSSPCQVTITNPAINYTNTVSLLGDTVTPIALPPAYLNHIATNTITNNVFHITSTANIALHAFCRHLASTGATMVIPTQYLDTHYIVQTYPGDVSRATTSQAEIGIVAVRNNTHITITPTSGAPTTISLNTGQTYIMSIPAPYDLSGYRVCGDKPFALFQGNSLAGIPTGSPSGDYIFEQCIPTCFWGTHYVVVSNADRQDGSRIRITPLTNNCHVQSSPANLNTTLSYPTTRELTMPYNSVWPISSNSPVCVGYYHLSSDYHGPIGDASQLIIPPINRGVRMARFRTFTTLRIHKTILNIVTFAGNETSIALDNIGIANLFSQAQGYSYARITFDNEVSNHLLTSTRAPFVAWVYGVGQVEDYVYSLGMSFDTMDCDTVFFSDTACQGRLYDNNGFALDSSELSSPGPHSFEFHTSTDTSCTTYFLDLLVLPPARGENLVDSIFEGDTLFYHGQPITTPGTYHHSYVAANGCDSIETLFLSYRVGCDSIFFSYSDTIVDGDTLFFNNLPLTSPGIYHDSLVTADGCDSIVTLNLFMKPPRLTGHPSELCLGDTATLTAVDILNHRWSSDPYDSRLDLMQGLPVIPVSPQTRTTYYLINSGGITVDSLVIDVQRTWPPCIDYSPAVINGASPCVQLRNCEPHRASSSWFFGDNTSDHGNTVQHCFQVGTEDSLSVTLSSCTSYGCCSDTAIWLPVTKASPLWFPNIFTPEKETNNLFKPICTFVIEYELWVFNRWGECIFHTTNPEEGWDGRYHGQVCEQASYAYLCRFSVIPNERLQKFGTVTLLK